MGSSSLEVLLKYQTVPQEVIGGLISYTFAFSECAPDLLIKYTDSISGFDIRIWTVKLLHAYIETMLRIRYIWVIYTSKMRNLTSMLALAYLWAWALDAY
jgi:hypothetical protein